MGLAHALTGQAAIEQSEQALIRKRQAEQQRLLKEAATRGAEFDKREQLDQIQLFLIPGEVLYAVYDCTAGGASFVGITNRRLIFYDPGSFWRSTKESIISIPYSQVAFLVAEQTGGLFLSSSKLTVVSTGGNPVQFSFPSNEKAQRAYELIMSELLRS